MDESLGCWDRVLSLKGWGNRKDYCALTAKMYWCKKYRESTLCLVAFSNSMRDKDIAKWFVLISTNSIIYVW